MLEVIMGVDVKIVINSMFLKGCTWNNGCNTNSGNS